MSTATKRRNRLRLLAHGDEPAIQRVCFYCRVSTDEQAEQNTVQMQLDYLYRRYQADFEGHGPVSMVHVEDFVDNGWSGAIPFADRPEGARALEWARDHRYNVLAVYKVDRLGRTAEVLLYANNDLENHDIALTSATEPFDMRPGPMQAFGRFVFQLLAMLAEFERSTIQARTMGGKLRIAKEGQFINGQVPFGFTVNPSGLLVPNRSIVPQVGMAESDLVAQLFERIAGGESCYGLAGWLSDLGVVSPRRWFNKEHQRLTEAEDAQVWTNRRVWETIRNTVYKGERNLSFDQAEHTQSVKPIVSTELWQRANDSMKRSNRTTWGPGRDHFTYLLQKKIRCQIELADGSRCDCFYTGGGSNGYHYYQCNGNDKTQARRRGGLRCRARMVRTELIEDAVWTDLVWQIRNRELALAKTQAIMRERQGRLVDEEAQVQERRRRRDTLTLARRHLRQLESSGQRPFEECEEDLADNARALAQVNEQLMVLEGKIESSEALERRYVQALPMLAELEQELDEIERSDDREAKRHMLDRLVTEIRILEPMKPAESAFDVRYRFRADNVVTNVSQFTNIMTIVIQGATPETNMRQVV